MTHDEMIAVIQAHKEGKQIQYRPANALKDKGWEDINPPSWNFHISRYRVKPAPREFYIPIWKSDPDNRWETAYTSKNSLLSTCEESELSHYIKVREVTD